MSLQGNYFGRSMLVIIVFLTMAAPLLSRGATRVHVPNSIDIDVQTLSIDTCSVFSGSTTKATIEKCISITMEDLHARVSHVARVIW